MVADWLRVGAGETNGFADLAQGLDRSRLGFSPGREIRDAGDHQPPLDDARPGATATT